MTAKKKAVKAAKTLARGAATKRTVKSALRSDMARTYKGLKSSKKK